jgi:CO/xanthine dehydrogenase Mo-binding subunit
MNAPFDPSLYVTEKFAVGQPVSRTEDPVLLRGEGRYSDDLNRPGELYGMMVRSRVAHGIPRSIDAEAAREITLRPGCQGVFGQRDLVSGILGIPVEKLRVLTGNVGGSFGMKASADPEYICLSHAARTLGQPVKWTDERSERFMSDSHGRDHEMTAELALDADGKFLALRVTGYGNLGAWLNSATTIPPTNNTELPP